ncbi:GNAT family N-acetyltransferase [Occultella glacieicola]|uniref:GNAT family N-acetyltransferase n=1 Tax=Occultella glacieicola TaxID=2518684 RepID=A0ABY2DXE8_9MICO|nr:GNAT family N-acetyltransferase [Occultella glacieicola]TDE88122.1 GNAT family N-acetyltransferase [Occultella glacieicola]
MTFTIRELTPADVPASRRLGAEAFGMPTGGLTDPQPTAYPAGMHLWGAFDADVLAARVIGREYSSWWDGAAVPTCGIAGVTVAAEYRGRGLLEPLFGPVLRGARERGEVISTLFPSAPGIYRRFGYELIGSAETVEVPTAAAAAVRPGTHISTRRATEADVPAVRAVYDTWAARQRGPLSRRGISFPRTDAEVIAAFTGVSLALDASGAVVGYVSWTRGPHESDSLEVEDLLALTADGYRALWRVLGSFSAVIPTIRLETSGADPARLVLPSAAWKQVVTEGYMLRLDDVAGAFAARRSHGSARARFAVSGDLLGTMDGVYDLTVDGGAIECRRVAVGPDAPGRVATFTPQGLALAWAGVQSCANLRLAGHLHGPEEVDAVIDHLFGAGQVHIRDHF